VSVARADGALEQLLAQASAAFSLQLTEPVLLGQGRATVVRARAQGTGDAFGVIVKCFEPRWSEHFAHERAGLRALSEIADGALVARLLAEDERSLLLLIEEVPGAPPLAVFLEGTDALRAEQALLATARGLGVVHGRARRRQLELPTQGLASPGNALREASAAILRFVALARAASPAKRGVGEGVMRMALEGLAQRVDEDGPLQTITLGDLAPSNVLVVGGRPLFIDLEYCARRHAFYDAVFWRAICPMPPSVIAALDRSYRSGLASSGVELDDQAFANEMSVLVAQRVFWTLSWGMDGLFSADREFAPGVSSRAIVRRYLHEFVRLAGGTVEGGELGALCDLGRELEELLARAWPEVDPALEFRCFREHSRD
jgi:hypothetical protein